LSTSLLSKSIAPQMAANSGNVYVVWFEVTDDGGKVYFSRSTNSGGSFSAPKQLDLGAGNSGSGYPQILASGSNVYVAWRTAVPIPNTSTYQYDVFFSKSNDSGSTFSTPKNLSNTIGMSAVISPISIAAEGQNVYLTWNEQHYGSNNYRSDIWLAKSSDSGNTFSSPVVVYKSSNTDTLSYNPSIAVKGNIINIVYYSALSSSTSAGPGEILLSRSTDGGVTFAAPKNLSNNSGDSGSGVNYRPQIAWPSGTNNNVYVVWGDRSVGAGSGILFNKSTDSGATFASTPTLMSQTTNTAFRPQIFASGSYVHVVWADVESGNVANEIKYRTSTNSGSSFQSIVNVSNSSADSIEPEIAANGASPHIVWREKTGTKYYDIMFKN